MYERYEFEVVDVYTPHASPRTLADRLGTLGNQGFSVACSFPGTHEGHIRIVLQRAVEVPKAEEPCAHN